MQIQANNTSSNTLSSFSSKLGDIQLDSPEFFRLLDASDSLKEYRQKFIIPKKKYIVKSSDNNDDLEQDCLYFANNSLGLQPKLASVYINQELEEWAKRAVLAHEEHDLEREWVRAEDELAKMNAKLIGASENEVCLMGTLTSNLHHLLQAFYKPSSKRNKILLEGRAFPSDHYAVESCIEVKGYNKGDSLVLLEPRKDEFCIRTQDIIDTLNEIGEEISVVLLPGVQYYTGQVFEFEKISKIAHQKGCFVGLDLAHAVGNIDVKLNEWDIDFAVWCSYKYMCSGPGNIGGLYVNTKNCSAEFKRLCGWWSHEEKTRFDMSNELSLEEGARGFRMSNPSITNLATLRAYLEIITSVDKQAFNNKRNMQTEYLEALITKKALGDKIQIITPKETQFRGCQMSLLFNESVNMSCICNKIRDKGVVCDLRKPNVLRIAPFPLVNTFEEIYRFVVILEQSLQ